MGKGFKTGVSGVESGVELNFTVTAYPSEVEMNTATPDVNTIGVVTNNPITGWYFAAEQPEKMVEGEVWIFTGTSITTSFNALKENTIMVYPMSAKQYVSGALVDKISKIYQNSKWVSWTKYYIQDGKLNETLSGVLRTGQTVSMSQQTDYVEIKATGQSSGGYAYHSPINVTNYSKLVLHIDILSGVYDQYAVGAVLLTALNASDSTNLNSNIIASETANAVGTHILECNISEYSGDYYIGIYVNCGDNSSKRPSAKIYDFYLA